MRKKVSLLLLAVSLAIVLPLSASAAATKVMSYVSYKDSKTGISLKYPKGWTKNIPTANSATNAMYSFLPSTNMMQVDVIMEDISANPVTLAQYIKAQNDSLVAADIGFVVKKQTKTKFLKQDAIRVETSMTINGITINGQQVYTLIGKKIYAALLTSTVDYYKTDVKIFNKVVTSVALKK
jgi:hypothetical protein